MILLAEFDEENYNITLQSYSGYETPLFDASSAFEIDNSPQQQKVIKTKRLKCQVAKCNGNKTRENCAICWRTVCGKCAGNFEKYAKICIDCIPKK